MAKKVLIVEDSIPTPIAMVDNPRIVVRAVIIIGRSLVFPASTSASFCVAATNKL